MDPSGNADPKRGIREFVVGTGGESLDTIIPSTPNLQASADQYYGVMALGCLGTRAYDPQVSCGPDLRTERLLLRRWRADDLAPFTAMNADREVMEHLPAPLSAAESAALAERIERGFEANGYGLWAVEVPGEADFVGFVGLAPVDRALPFAPSVEVGWRLARAFWGRGIATEAARAAVEYGLRERGLRELVSFTAVGNARSRRVMERLGMHRDPGEDFDHPLLPARSPLRRHVLYRLRDSERRSCGSDTEDTRSHSP